MSIRGMPEAGPGAGAHVRDWGGTLRRLLALLKAQPARLATILAATACSVALHVIGPWQLGRATDLVYAGVTGHHPIDFAHLARLLGFVAVLYAGSSALNWWQAWLSTGLLQAIEMSASAASQAGVGPATASSPQPQIDLGKLYSGGFAAIGFGR